MGLSCPILNFFVFVPDRGVLRKRFLQKVAKNAKERQEDKGQENTEGGRQRFVGAPASSSFWNGCSIPDHKYSISTIMQEEKDGDLEFPLLGERVRVRGKRNAALGEQTRNDRPHPSPLPQGEGIRFARSLIFRVAWVCCRLPVTFVQKRRGRRFSLSSKGREERKAVAVGLLRCWRPHQRRLSKSGPGWARLLIPSPPQS